jgi:hypothetical protein
MRVIEQLDASGKQRPDVIRELLDGKSDVALGDSQ